VDDQLHPTGLIEESLRDQGLLSGKCPKESLGLGEIFDELVGSGL
jgi:hypothetical protein